MDVRFAILGAAGSVGGLFAFFWGLRCYQRKRLMQNTPTSKVEAVALGLAELCGRAVAHEPLTSPIEQLPCVYWRYQVEELRRSGKSSHWATIDRGERRVPFYLEDETGKILVVPVQATIDIPKDLCEQTRSFNAGLSACTLAFAEQRGIEVEGMFTRSKRFTEWMIAPGDPLFVFGSVMAPDGQLAGLTKTEDRIVCQDGTSPFFFIADRSARDVETEFALKAAGGIFGGALLAVAGLGIVLEYFHAL
ncbi:MAG TPA: GIDE domain-containing protein [Verrucomicrobiae bacterium]|nr:GIDE domain-containing protein [Verrucomicrobiae bacterium]